MKQPLLSVIMPVYNKEKYLGQSIKSLIAQTFTNTEIILIDDGSTDNSLNIMNEFKKQCDRIIIISQDNKGASAARNEGIRNANGKYIIMMDADDTVEKEMHEDMVIQAEKFKADVVVCNFATHLSTDASKIFYNRLDYPNNVLLEREYIEKAVIPYSLCLTNPKKFINAHCTIMLRREMLINNKVRYNENHKKEEDKPFIMNCLKFTERMVFVEGTYYNYIKRKGSLISSYSDHFNNLLNNFALYKKLFSDIYDFNSEEWIKYFISNYEECIRYVLIHRKNAGNVKEKIMNIIQHPESIKTFSLLQNGYEPIKQLYEKNNFNGIYKYYMKKFFKLRIKILIKEILKK